MKIFWSDREGKPPPLHCRFHLHSFSSENLTQQPIERIDKLPPPISVKATQKTFLPEKEQWIQNIETALELIQKKELQKVVLARSCTLELAEEPDPFAIASALKQKAQGAFVFCFQTENYAFLGASPERLFVRKGTQITSEAVAGTRRRGKTFYEDQKLQKQLITSVKDLREFTPVQQYLQSALFPLCQGALSFSPISIHQTQNVQHLYSRCFGTLKETATDEQILENLHPTPALCGMPKEKAFATIKQLEPFERGLYGGAVGWSTPETSEFIVGIRSCLIQGKTVRLFSGTGIVEGSDPEKEWDELNQKLKLYDGILDY